MGGRRLVVGLAAVVSAVVTFTAAACDDDVDQPAGPAPTAPTAGATPAPSPGDRVEVAGETAIYHGSEDITGSSRVTIDMEDSYFSPTVLRGEPGQKVVVTLRNRGENPHHFTTSDEQLIVEVQPGLTAEGRLTLPASGNLAFHCLLHRRSGMAGAFNVSGPVIGERPSPGATRSPGATPTR